jgi:hypothetical protein
MHTLTPRMELFIDHVLTGMNHTAAAREAGYCPGSDDKALASYAATLYGKLLPEIEARRLKAVARATIDVDLSIHRTLLETYHHAHHDPRCVLSWGPDGAVVRPSKDLTPEQARLVKSVSSTVTEHLGKDGTVTSRVARVKLELVDRQAALARMAEYQGLTAGDPSLDLRVPGAAAAKADEDAQASMAKLAEEIRDTPTTDLMQRWRESRATAAAARLPVPA